MMAPGDIVVWKDAKFGHHRIWTIESFLYGSTKQESLVRLTSLSHSAGNDENGQEQSSVLVPEVLIRGLVYTSVAEGDD